MIAKAAEVGGNFLSSIGNFFGQLPGRIGSFLSNALSTVAGWVSNMIAKAREVGSNVLSTIGNFSGKSRERSLPFYLLPCLPWFLGPPTW